MKPRPSHLTAGKIAAIFWVACIIAIISDWILTPKPHHDLGITINWQRR